MVVDYKIHNEIFDTNFTEEEFRVSSLIREIKWSHGMVCKLEKTGETEYIISKGSEILKVWTLDELKKYRDVVIELI